MVRSISKNTRCELAAVNLPAFLLVVVIVINLPKLTAYKAEDIFFLSKYKVVL